jgi:hypothetical protein
MTLGYTICEIEYGEVDIASAHVDMTYESQDRRGSTMSNVVYSQYITNTIVVVVIVVVFNVCGCGRSLCP